MTKDMWERVYLQSSNEVNASTQNPHIWITDGADAGTYSLEGNYGCCTANMHAGWPKFTNAAIGIASNNTIINTIVIGLWAPITTVTPFGSVSIVTDYPFGDTATVTITPATALTTLSVSLRIPSWAGEGSYTVNGGGGGSFSQVNGTFLTVSISPSTPTTFVIDFAPSIRLEPAYNGAVSISRGALTYAVWIGQTITATESYAYNSKDLDIRATTSSWNIALSVDRTNPAASLTFTRAFPPTAIPFNSTQVPVYISGKGRVVTSWGAEKNAPSAPPSSPACAVTGACETDLIDIIFVPFGSTHVRMTVIPTV